MGPKKDHPQDDQVPSADNDGQTSGETPNSNRAHLDEEVEEADIESFPASDPPEWTLGRDPQG